MHGLMEGGIKGQTYFLWHNPSGVLCGNPYSIQQSVLWKLKLPVYYQRLKVIFVKPATMEVTEMVIASTPDFDVVAVSTPSIDSHKSMCNVLNWHLFASKAMLASDEKSSATWLGLRFALAIPLQSWNSAER